MDEQLVRQALIGTINGGQAFMTIDVAVSDFPSEHYNTQPPNVLYSFWAILEHIRLCSTDILDYIRNPDYRELEWPLELWPPAGSTADSAAWNATISAIHADLAEYRALVENSSSDLTSLALHADGNATHTLLREILVVLDHNAYHLGEFAILRQVMGLWPADHA